MWNIISISECERNEIHSVSASTTFGTTISKNYRRGKRCVKSGKNCVGLSIMWVVAPELMIQDEVEELTKQEISGYVKVAMSEVETEYIF